MEEIFNTELGRKILALTKASFKVSDLIPDLVLREKIKYQALEVYKTFLIDSRNQSLSEGVKNHSELLKEIDILDQYFYLGGHLNLIKEEHLEQLRNGFLVFKSHIVLAMNQKLQLSTSDVDNLRGPDEEINVRHQEIPNIGRRIKFGDRQEKILKKFQNKETLKLEEILELFPDVSERTIRNELNSLIGIGKIARNGRGNGSFYRLLG